MRFRERNQEPLNMRHFRLPEAQHQLPQEPAGDEHQYKFGHQDDNAGI